MGYWPGVLRRAWGETLELVRLNSPGRAFATIATIVVPGIAAFLASRSLDPITRAAVSLATVVGIMCAIYLWKLLALPPRLAAEALARTPFQPGGVWEQFAPRNWDAPLEKVFRHHYKNETVELDGREFIECRFENVSFRFQGTRPWRATDCRYGAPDTPPGTKIETRIVTDNPIVGQAFILAKAAGVMPSPTDYEIWRTESR